MIRSVVVSVAVSSLFAAAGETRASLVTYNADTSALAADAYQFSPDLGDSQSQIVPGAGSFQASSGNSLSSNQYQLDDSRIWVSFHLHQDGSTSVDQAAYANSTGFIEFTANAALNFSLANALAVTTGTNDVSEQVTLYDETTDTTLYAYSFGLAQGDGTAVSTSGALTPGDTYLVAWDNNLVDAIAGTSGDAVGQFQLGFAVPEPAAIALLPAVVIATLRRRRGRDRMPNL